MLCDMSSLHMSPVCRTYVTGTSKLHNIPPGWPQGQLKTRVVHSSHFRAIFGSFWSHFLISFLKNGLQNEPKMNYFWKIEAYPRFCKNHHFSVHFHFPFFSLFQTPLQCLHTLTTTGLPPSTLYNLHNSVTTHRHHSATSMSAEVARGRVCHHRQWSPPSHLTSSPPTTDSNDTSGCRLSPRYFFFYLCVFYILTSTFQVSCRLARYKEDPEGATTTSGPNDARRASFGP